MNLMYVTSTEHMIGENPAETAALQAMQQRAEKYLRSFAWCPPITERYLGMGIGGALSLWLFKLETAVKGTDQWLWVVVGDLPSAYFIVDQAQTPRSALDTYCQLMEAWVEAVELKLPLDEVFPINVSPTLAHAHMLRSRIQFVRETILPTL